MVYTFLIFCAITVLLYIYQIFIYIVGWKSIITHFSNTSDRTTTFVSVVVAVRNEEYNVTRLIKKIYQQKYKHFECIIINDHSTDGTLSILKSLQKEFGFLLLNMTLEAGKKYAVNKGIGVARGVLIVTTDADCSFGDKWLSTIVSFYEQNLPSLIIAPVIMKAPVRTFFAQCLELEFMSLTATAAGSAGAKKAVLCNAANMAFKKDIYHKYSNQLKYHLASGDDVFLLSAIKQHESSQNILFLKSEDAIVSTPPPENWNSFIMQRARWASKGKHYTDSDIKWSGATVLVFNILIFFLYILALFSPATILYSLILLCAKSTVDFIILNEISIFLKCRKLLWLFPVVQLVYPFYIMLILLYSIGGVIKWKERII